jgi:alpha-beta hydrolase superfamily lysophospholipase
MDTIAQTLARHGVECLRVSLSGHREVGDPVAPVAVRARSGLKLFRSVTRELWLSELRDAYEVARARADECRIPLLLVGYSLGAVLGCDLLQSAEVSFDAMILFAPAFRTHWYTRSLRFLRPFPRLTLPSWSPTPYGANAGTPIAAYTALFQSIAAVRVASRARTIPALIFATPKDELVSFKHLRDLCESSAAPHWELVPVERRLQPGRRDFHHLMIDRDCLGSELWDDIEQRMLTFVQRCTSNIAR